MNNDIIVDLIIDGNFILNKMVFPLHKNKLMPNLYDAMMNNILNYKKLYPFKNVYLVSDSKYSSWRKKLYPEYKGNRKKDEEIDWEYAFEVYDSIKNDIKDKNVKVLEFQSIEGDDWISFLVNESNKNDRSAFIVSNDGDIAQLLKYNIQPNYINVMFNESINNPKMTLPINYKIFLDHIKNLNNDDIFNLNDNFDFVTFLDNMTIKYKTLEICPMEALIVKLIHGDSGDNIKSVYIKTNELGKSRGIGEAGAKTIYDSFIKEYGEPDINISDNDLYENISDIICEKKKLNNDMISSISKNLSFNNQLISLKLDTLPKPIVNKMKEIYNKI